MRKAIIAAAIGIGCLVASTAGAEVVTRSFDLKASDFVDVEDSSPGPIDEIVGRFTVTFDRSLTSIEPTTTGVSVDSFDFDYDGTVSFTVGYGTLVIGTSLVPGGFYLNRQPRGFGLIIGLTDDFARFAYSDGIDSIFDARSVDVTSGASAVPEPAGWVMMIGGFSIAGSALRRRKLSVRSSISLR